MRRIVAATVCCFVLLAGPASAQSRPYNDSIDAYRRGEFDKAIAGFRKMPVEEAVLEVEASIKTVRRFPTPAGVRDLQTALLLHTQVTLLEALDASFLPTAGLAQRTRTIKVLHDFIKAMEPEGSLLLNWYLLWEAFLQGHRYPSVLLQNGDYLASALRTFPEDAELLLAYGCRHEVRWWIHPENPQRDPTPERGLSNLLVDAAAAFRSSVKANPKLVDARLRLGHTLTLLNNLDEARAELDRVISSNEDPLLQYLAFLFIGQLQERRGDRAAASKAYEAAIPLAADAQSARIAAAHLAYSDGKRAEAARAVERTLALTPAQTDPWIWYIQGQYWTYSHYLSKAQTLVK